MNRTQFSIFGMIAALAFGIASAANSQAYPNRPITIVVPFAAGGLTDVPVRILAKVMQDSLHVPVIVENKPGGSGMIGATYVLRAEPDGYTLLANAVADTQNLFYLKVPYSAIKDFAIIGKIVDGPPLVMIVNAKLPYKSVAELTADAKAHPEQVSFGTSGYATSPFIALNELNDTAGTKIVAVPYHGSGEAAIALVSGAIQGTFTFYLSAKPLATAGQVRALAVAGPKRIPDWPNVPTMEELGFKQFDYNGFVGLAAPGKTSPDVTAFLNKALNEAIHTVEFKTRMAALGMTVPETADNTQEKFKAFLQSETNRQGELAKSVLAKISKVAPSKP